MSDETHTGSSEALAARQANRSVRTTGIEPLAFYMTALEALRLVDILNKASDGLDLTHGEIELAIDLASYIQEQLQ